MLKKLFNINFYNFHFQKFCYLTNFIKKIDDNSRFKHYIVDLILYCHIKDFCDFLIKIICLLKLYIIYLIFHYNLIHNK